jgi:hypothetical protein
MCCSFCSNDAEKLFCHFTHNLGSLCIECYMRFHGSCGVCSQALLPSDLLPDVSYRVQAKFIGFGDKNLIVCNSCFEAVHKEFSHMF